MTVIVGLQVPVEGLGLMGDLAALDGAVTVPGAVRDGDAGVALFGVMGDEEERFTEVVTDDPSVTAVEPIPTSAPQRAYAVVFDTLPAPLWETLDRFDATLITAETDEDGDGCHIEVALPDQHHVAEFQDLVGEMDVPIEMERRFDPSRPEPDTWYGLTEPQREALSLARRRGFFEVPRRCTVEDLAEEFDISAQAMSERLRRATGRLVMNTMLFIEDR